MSIATNSRMRMTQQQKTAVMVGAASLGTMMLARAWRARHAIDFAGKFVKGQDTILFDATLSADLACGDRVYIGTAGAYTTAYAARFNGFDVPAVRCVPVGYHTPDLCTSTRSGGPRRRKLVACRTPESEPSSSAAASPASWPHVSSPTSTSTSPSSSVTCSPAPRQAVVACPKGCTHTLCSRAAARSSKTSFPA